MRIRPVMLARCKGLRLVLAWAMVCCWTVNIGLAADEAGSRQAVSGEVRPTKHVRSMTVSLRKDGTLVGRAVRPADGKQSVPVRAKITFFEPDQIVEIKQGEVSNPQPGLVVNATWSNEDGYFQIPGMEPGKYRVTGKGKAMQGTAEVQVVAYDPNSPDQNQWLDFVLDESEPPAEPVTTPPQAMVMDGSMMGPAGAAGGAGGMAGLLGVAGLAAGIAGIATSSSGSTPVASSTVPVVNGN